MHNNSHKAVEQDGSSDWWGGGPDCDRTPVHISGGRTSAVRDVLAVITTEDTGDPSAELVGWPRVRVIRITAALADASRFDVSAVLWKKIIMILFLFIPPQGDNV